MVFVTDADATPTKGVNSYVTVEEVMGNAGSLNYTVTNISPCIFRAMDFIESFRDDYQGVKTSATQPLQWPRRGVIVDGYPIDEATIPEDLRKAVSICAIEMCVQGYDPHRPLRPSEDAEVSSDFSVFGSRVSERYLVNWGLQDVLPRVDALLSPLFRDDADDIVVRI